MATSKKGGGSKIIKSRTKQENDDRLIMAMQWIWSDDYEEQYKNQFGIDDEWSKCIYFDRVPLNVMELKEYPDDLRPPPWIDSGAGKPKRVAVSVCGVEAAFRGGYITAEDLLQSRENVIDHTTKMRLLKEAALLKNLSAKKRRGSLPPPAPVDEEESKEGAEDIWWPNVEEGLYTFHEQLGAKACTSAVTARHEMGKLTVEGWIRDVSKSAKRVIANKVAREEQERIEQARLEKERRKRERRNALLRIETDEGVLQEDGTIRRKSTPGGAPESSEGGADGKYLGQTPKFSQSPKSGPSPISVVHERKKLDDDFAHAFDDWNPVADDSKTTLQPSPEAQGRKASPNEKEDGDGKVKTKKGKSKGRERSNVDGSTSVRRRKSMEELEPNLPDVPLQRRKSQPLPDTDAVSSPGKRIGRISSLEQGGKNRDKDTPSSPKRKKSTGLEVESEQKEEGRKSRGGKRGSDVGAEDIAKRSILSAASPGASASEDGGGTDDREDDDSDSEDSQAKQEPAEEVPNLSWWGWPKKESYFNTDHCAVVHQLVEMTNQREACQMIKEVYKPETKSKNKASFNSIVRLFAAAEDVAEQFLRIKMDRYATFADEAKVKQGRTKNFRQLVAELEKSVWGNEPTEELVKHTTGGVGDKVTISEEHKNNPSLYEYVNKIGVLVRRDADIEGWWADFTGQDGKPRRRQEPAKKKPVPQTTAEKIKSMRAKITKQDRNQPEVFRHEARPERLFCTGHNGRFWLAFVEKVPLEEPVPEEEQQTGFRNIGNIKPEAASGARERARRTKRKEQMITERVQHIKERAGLMTAPKTGGGKSATSGGGGNSPLNSTIGTQRRGHRRSLDVSSVALAAMIAESKTSPADPVVQFQSVPSTANSATMSLPSPMPSPLLPPIARASPVRSKLILDSDEDDFIEDSSFSNLDV